MLLLDDIKLRQKTLKAKLADVTKAVDPERLKARRAELDEIRQDPDLYKDNARAAKINGEAKYIEDRLNLINRINREAEEIEEMIELVEAEDAGELVSELESGLDRLEAETEQLQLTTLLKGEYDANNAILTLHAGAGGTEAQDWVSMLYRMYRMYSDRNGFTVEELDSLPGDEAGIKSVTFMVKGVNAYGYLKAERGVHRLVRISPFDSNARRHTSFASLDVMPEVENDNTVKINPDELRIDRYRSGGAGGQHVNKTDSAVRITHLPTGIVVQCQNERSQIQNRETAMKVLMGKLVELKERERLEKSNELKGDLKKIEWGSQIRSYVFQPYTMVKDHRTNFEKTDISAVMDGAIEGFIFDYLIKSA